VNRESSKPHAGHFADTTPFVRFVPTTSPAKPQPRSPAERQ
jgi:hypothetical protein